MTESKVSNQLLVQKLSKYRYREYSFLKTPEYPLILEHVDEDRYGAAKMKEIELKKVMNFRSKVERSRSDVSFRLKPKLKFTPKEIQNLKTSFENVKFVPPKI